MEVIITCGILGSLAGIVFAMYWPKKDPMTDYYNWKLKELANPSPKTEGQIRLEKSYQELMKITHPLYGCFDDYEFRKGLQKDDLLLKMLMDSYKPIEPTTPTTPTPSD